MGERMEIRTLGLFFLAGVICHCRRMGDPGQHPWMGRTMLPHGSEFLITRVNTATYHWGGERGLRKNIHLEFFLFFASLHCVTKYISALSHILVQ